VVTAGLPRDTEYGMEAMMADETRAAQPTTQVFGLALLSAVLVIFVIVGFLLLGGEDASFGLVLGAILIATTFVVWKVDKTWARVVGLVVTLGVGLMMWWMVFGILQVFSPIEFTVGLMFLLGILLALVGGIRAVIRGRRGAAGLTRVPPRLRKGTLGLIGLAAVISIAGFLFTRQSVSEAEAAGATALLMADFEFDPATTSIASGETLLVTNTDPFAHDFTLDQAGIYVHFGPGDEAVIDVSDLPPGTYQYYCSLHSDGTEGMMGTITIGS
jgi:plastocyanin